MKWKREGNVGKEHEERKVEEVERQQEPQTQSELT